jgi:hypothetical protein
MLIYVLLDKKISESKKLLFESPGGTRRTRHGHRGKSYFAVFILIPTQVIQPNSRIR